MAGGVAVRTEEEWKALLKDQPIDCDEAEGTFIQAVQLDAMREGMRRAASIASSGKTADKYADAGMKMCSEAILSAAEQLTEKDL